MKFAYWKTGLFAIFLSQEQMNVKKKIQGG